MAYLTSQPTEQRSPQAQAHGGGEESRPAGGGAAGPPLAQRLAWKARNFRLLWLNNGLLWGIVAYSFELLGLQGEVKIPHDSLIKQEQQYDFRMLLPYSSRMVSPEPRSEGPCSVQCDTRHMSCTCKSRPHQDWIEGWAGPLQSPFYVRTCVCMYVCMNDCMHIYIYMYAYMYASYMFTYR